MANTEAKKCEFCGAPRESRVVVSLDPQPLRDLIQKLEAKGKRTVRELLMEEIEVVHDAIIRSASQINGGAVPELVDAQIKLVSRVANGVYL